jgi:hypothetical protein
MSELPPSVKEYRIISRAILPTRFKGNFTFEDAHQLCCDWNFGRDAETMAFPEKIDGGCFLEDL